MAVAGVAGVADEAEESEAAAAAAVAAGVAAGVAVGVVAALKHNSFCQHCFRHCNTTRTALRQMSKYLLCLLEITVGELGVVVAPKRAFSKLLY